MLQGNPHKRHLQTEVQGEGEDRVRVKLNEIRESDLEFDSATQNLRIVNDEIAVVPRSEQPVRVPQSVTRRGFRKALRRAGITFKQVKQTVADPATGLDEDTREDALIDIEDAQTVRRDHSLITLIGAIFGKTDEEIDAVFVQAPKLDK